MSARKKRPAADPSGQWLRTAAVAGSAAFAGFAFYRNVLRTGGHDRAAAPGDTRRPPLPRLLKESLGGLRATAAQFKPARRRDPSVGAGQAVFVIPGFLINDMSTLFLRRTLKALGFRPFGWANGMNLGFRRDLFDRLGARLDEIVSEAGGPVALVGWSLGGLYARELARRRPDDVSLVITLGTPFSGDVRATNATWLYEAINDHCLDRPPVPVQFDAKPQAYTVAIWGLRDGVVAPAAASGKPGERDRQIAVDCSHNELASHPESVSTIIEVLTDTPFRQRSLPRTSK